MPLLPGLLARRLPGAVGLRPATADDAYLLADIAMAATEAQGRWPARTAREDDEWRAGFADWTRQTVEEADPLNILAVILDGENAIGRLRVKHRAAGERRAEDEPRVADEQRAVDERPAAVELAGLQLLPAAQNRGIGTAIVRGLQDVAAREGVPLLIGVEKDNPGARRLYERLGCVLVGEDGDEHRLRWTPGDS